MSTSSAMPRPAVTSPHGLADLSGLSDDSANVMRKRLEFEAAMQQHTQRLAETVEIKERRIHELSKFLERVTTDYNYNLELITALQDDLALEREGAAEVARRLEDAQQETQQHKAARALLEAELRRCRQQYEADLTEHEKVTAELRQTLHDMKLGHERDGARWAAEHNHAIAELRSQRESDVIAAKVNLQQETQALRDELMRCRAENSKALNEANAKLAEAESVARFHEDRTGALTADLEASRGFTIAERQRGETIAEGLQAQLRQAEAQCRDLLRQVSTLDGALNAVEERQNATLRQESARVSDLQLSVSAAESTARLAQQQLDAVKKSEQETLQRLREVSMEWETKHTEVCKSTGGRIRELEVAVRTAQAASDEHQRAVSVNLSEIARLQRDLDRTKESLRIAESDLATASTGHQQAQDQVTRLTASEARAQSAMRIAEARYKEQMAHLESEVNRATHENQRAQREHISALQKVKDENSELRKQLSASEAARLGVDEALQEFRKANHPAQIAHQRDEIERLQHQLSLKHNECHALRVNVESITNQLSADALFADQENKARRIDALLAELQHERAGRETAEALTRQLRHDIAATERARSEVVAKASRSASRGRRSESSSRSRRTGGRTGLEWRNDDDEDSVDYDSDAADDADGDRRGSGAPPTVMTSLRREVRKWRDRCRDLEEELEVCSRERSDVWAECEQLRHRAELLSRQRDDLTTLNARLNHEAKRFRGLVASDAVLMPPSADSAAVRAIAAMPSRSVVPTTTTTSTTIATAASDVRGAGYKSSAPTEQTDAPPARRDTSSPEPSYIGGATGRYGSATSTSRQQGQSRGANLRVSGQSLPRRPATAAGGTLPAEVRVVNGKSVRCYSGDHEHN